MNAGQGRRLTGNTVLRLRYGTGRECHRYLGHCQQDNEWALEQIQPETSLEAKKTKLKWSFSGHLMRRQDSLEKTIMLGKAEGSRERGTGQNETDFFHERSHGRESTGAGQGCEDRALWGSLTRRSPGASPSVVQPSTQWHITHTRVHTHRPFKLLIWGK